MSHDEYYLRSFGTLVQLNTLLQVYRTTKLGLTKNGQVQDLGSVQGAKQKASGYGARRTCPGLFTEFLQRFSSLARDISDRPKAQLPGPDPVAEEGVEGSWNRANLALQMQNDLKIQKH